MADTLVLDANWRPVGFVRWTTAVKLWYEGVATIVKEDESGMKLHSQNFEMGMPRVITVKNAWVRRRRKEVPFCRRNVLTRDDHTCQYCGHDLNEDNLTLDHVVPRSQGGISSWTNLVAACLKCNKKRGGMTPEQAGMKLLRVPFEPKVTDKKYNFKLRIRKLRPEWKEWSNWLYWAVELDQ